MMIKASAENVGKTEYWERVHTELAKPESKSAYFDYLMNKDISQFNPRKFPRTEYMDETVAAMRPQSAAFFQHEIEKAEGRAIVGDEADLEGTGYDYQDKRGCEVPTLGSEVRARDEEEVCVRIGA